MFRKGRGEGCPLQCDLSHDACYVTNPPSPGGQTDACDNITFPRAVIKDNVRTSYEEIGGKEKIANLLCICHLQWRQSAKVAILQFQMMISHMPNEERFSLACPLHSLVRQL